MSELDDSVKVKLLQFCSVPEILNPYMILVSSCLLTVLRMSSIAVRSRSILFTLVAIRA
jgi:hypothetical protein